MVARRRLQLALLAACLIAGAATGVVTVGSASDGSTTGAMESTSWNLTVSNASTLRVAFRVNASDPPPSVFLEVDPGRNRTPDNRSLAAGIVWNRTEFIRGFWTVVNEDGSTLAVRARNTSVTSPTSSESGSPGQIDGGDAGGTYLPVGSSGRWYEATLMAVPPSPMRVNITAPGGGTILDVDRNPGPATLTPFERFDDWQGLRGVPGAYSVSNTNSVRNPSVALVYLDTLPGASTGRYEVETPQGCTLRNQWVWAGTYVDDPSRTCPTGATQPKSRQFLPGSLWYRGTEGGQFHLDGTVAPSMGGRMSFVATGEFPADG